MAEKKKSSKSSGTRGRKRPSSSRRRTSSKRSTRSRGNSGTRFLESLLEVFLFAFCILLLISCFGNGGYVGGAISSLEYGAFGILAPLFPVLLFITILLLWVGKKSSLFFKRLLAGALLFSCLCAAAQFVTEGYIESFSLMDYYARSADYHVGGGLVGGGLCLSLCAAFGRVGAILLCTLIALCCLIVLTQPSLVGVISSFVEGIGLPLSSRLDNLDEDEDALYERELRQQLREETTLRRNEERRLRRVKKLEEKLEREREKLSLSSSQDEEEDEERSRTKRTREKPATPQRATKARSSEEFEMEENLAPSKNRRGEKEAASLEFHGISQEELSELDDEEWGEDPYEDSSDLGIFQATKAKKEKAGEKEKKPSSAHGQKAASAKGGGEEEFSIPQKQEKPRPPYQPPSLELLAKGNPKVSGQSREELSQVASKLEQILQDFGVEVTVTDVSCGPTVTRYEISPEPGVKVSKIVNLADDIKLNLAAPDIRIEAPIPGKAAVGIEVPNKESSPVMLRDLISSQEFKNSKSKISFAVGKDIGGKPIVTDIAKMPHLLIAGATGSGKSVCINTLIVSILYKASPDEVQLIMIDPKVVELSVYNGIPHLLIPVVTDPKKASGALNWGVAEMTRRYNTFAEYGVRNIGEYNRKLEETSGEAAAQGKMSQIVIIVDELADLMMVAPGEVEEAICRLAQLARAAGIHLVIATQRPSVNVITGLIKANMPSRIAFAVSSGVDSRTILDTYGAEKLLGKGDMLFAPQGAPKPSRLQGAFVSDDEISEIVGYLSQFTEVTYDKDVQDQVETASASIGAPQEGAKDERDQFFTEAALAIIDKDKASIGMLQRLFKIGFNRAARIMDQLAEAGVVGPDEGTKARKVIMSREEFQNQFGVS